MNVLANAPPAASAVLIEEAPLADPLAVLAPFADDPFSLLLHSSSAGPEADPACYGRWSFVALDPFAHVAVETLEKGDPFETVNVALRPFSSPPAAGDPALPPFRGGAAGFFSYDLGRAFDDLPPAEAPFAVDDTGTPLLALGLYDAVYAVDHHEGRAFVCSTGWPERDAGARRERARQRADWLGRLAASAPAPGPVTPAPNPRARPLQSDGAVRDAVQRTIDFIHEGDIFQANIARRFESSLAEPPFMLYRRLARVSPAPFAAYFRLRDGAVLSSSPERFLKLRGDRVETKPIKGTRPRKVLPADDAREAEALQASEKDRAENVMIVDLLRNDLSKVCRDHSVHVTRLCALESFANVHHLVSTVEGRLRPGKSSLDLLKAAFPGGSITGAPKKRAMEIIAALEPVTRGPYCGAIGYLGFDGAMDLNVAIRTLTVNGERVLFHAGGGIVADSAVEAELKEMQDKASGMNEALSGPGSGPSSGRAAS